MTQKTNCPKCPSSDGFVLFSDGGYCFVCGYSTNDTTRTNTIKQQPYKPFNMADIHSYRSYALHTRGISQEIVDYFNVKMSVNSEGKPDAHYYPYTKEGQTVAYKERKLPKEFRTHGDFKGTELFGQAQVDGGKTLIITEGEIDCLSVAQAFKEYKGRIYPVVSLPSASGTNAVLLHRDWVNSFDTVILMLDQDEAGKKAQDTIAKMINNVKIATLPEKDPNETLVKHGYMAILKAIWNAKTWSPAGIIRGEAIWNQFQEAKNVQSIPYPDCLDGLNHKLKGLRHGEITLFTSGTGSGKSTVIKEIILNLLDKTEDKIGLISLEESVADTASKLISMSLKKSLTEPPPPTEGELREGFEKVFSDERLILLDHQGSVGDDSLLNKIEYMALAGCKYLVLDHITIAVSEGSDKLSGNEAIDKIMSDLLKIVKKHNVWLGLISHLRKTQGGGTSFEEGKLASMDDIKGSGSIKQISFDIIAFARNVVAEDEAERNTVRFRVLKSRFTGLTGDAGAAYYDIKTTRLRDTGGFSFEAGAL